MIQPDGMFGFGEKKPAFDQQAHDTARRRGKRRLPAHVTHDKPRERQTEAEHERHAAQAPRVLSRQFEAEFAGQKSTMRMADVREDGGGSREQLRQQVQDRLVSCCARSTPAPLRFKCRGAGKVERPIASRGWPSPEVGR